MSDTTHAAYCAALKKADKRIEALTHENAALKGAMKAQDERETQAGERCGVPYEAHECDWPEAVADAVLALRSSHAELQQRLGNMEREYLAIAGDRGRVQMEKSDAQCDARDVAIERDKWKRRAEAAEAALNNIHRVASHVLAEPEDEDTAALVSICTLIESARQKGGE